MARRGLPPNFSLIPSPSSKAQGRGQFRKRGRVVAWVQFGCGHDNGHTHSCIGQRRRSVFLKSPESEFFIRAAPTERHLFLAKRARPGDPISLGFSVAVRARRHYKVETAIVHQCSKHILCIAASILAGQQAKLELAIGQSGSDQAKERSLVKSIATRLFRQTQDL